MNSSDKKSVLEAVKQNGYSLKNASEKLKNDKEVVIEAVKQNGYSLQFASEELKNNKEVVLEAVKQNGCSLQFASIELNNDKEVVISAVKQNRSALEYVINPKLRNDEDILSKARTIKWEVDIRRFEMKRNDHQPHYDSYDEGKFGEMIFHHHLGRGAFGSTYRCSIPIREDGTLEKSKQEKFKFYVIKIYLNLYLQTEKKEENLSKEIMNIPSHENIVPILKHWPNETVDIHKLPDYETFWKKRYNNKRYFKNCPVFVMNCYRSTLKNYLDARKYSLDISEIRKMFWGLICGVFHLHDNMIVHRDLHASNIFIVPHNEKILIGDFGCSLDLRKNPTKFIVHKDQDIMFSFTINTYFKEEKSGEIVGFDRGGYSEMLPPEIRKFDPTSDDSLDYSKSDVYSLGKVGLLLLKHLKKGESDFGLRVFMNRLVVIDPTKRLGCPEVLVEGKFIEIEKEEVEEAEGEEDEEKKK